MIVVALAAAAAAVLVLLVALGVLWTTVRRLRTSTDSRVADAVADLNQRMELMVEELQDALARAHEEGRRNRFLGELGGSIDLDEVTGRVLEAAGSLHGADAAMLSLDDSEGGAPTASTLGLSAEEAERQVIAGPPDGRDVRSISIGYRYSSAELSKGEPLIHGGHAAVTELELLADRAGPAIENARRFREARQLADLDALTGLHNRRYFHETLARECARAHRYDRRLALIVFDVDDFKAVNDRIGHLAGDAVLAEVAERVRSVVRSAAVACRIGGDEFAVIMPESGVEDAGGLSQRLQATVSARPILQAGRLEISAGVAELIQSDDAAGLFERADEALYRAKEAGKGRVVTATAQNG